MGENNRVITVEYKIKGLFLVIVVLLSIYRLIFLTPSATIDWITISIIIANGLIILNKEYKYYQSNNDTRQLLQKGIDRGWILWTILFFLPVTLIELI